MALDTLQKGCLSTVRERTETRSRVRSCSTLAGGMQVGQLKFPATLHMSTDDQRVNYISYGRQYIELTMEMKTPKNEKLHSTGNHNAKLPNSSWSMQ